MVTGRVFSSLLSEAPQSPPIYVPNIFPPGNNPLGLAFSVVFLYQLNPPILALRLFKRLLPIFKFPQIPMLMRVMLLFSFRRPPKHIFPSIMNPITTAVSSSYHEPGPTPLCIWLSTLNLPVLNTRFQPSHWATIFSHTTFFFSCRWFSPGSPCLCFRAPYGSTYIFLLTFVPVPPSIFGV